MKIKINKKTNTNKKTTINILTFCQHCVTDTHTHTLLYTFSCLFLKETETLPTHIQHTNALQLCKNYFYGHFASQPHTHTDKINMYFITSFRFRIENLLSRGIYFFFIYNFSTWIIVIKLNTNHFRIVFCIFGFRDLLEFDDIILFALITFMFYEFRSYSWLIVLHEEKS